MTIAATNALAGLASRLTNPDDRERYTAILLYLQTLPQEDEFRHLAELMGLLSLLGERVPAALADAMTELRELSMAAADYHDKVDERLANLPAEIAEGVNVGKIVKDLGEAFRQQFAATGLQSSAGLLRDSTREITALSDKLAATLAPLGENYSKIAGAISTELERLSLANRSMQAYNAQLIREQPGNSWMWFGMALVVMFLLGGVCGDVSSQNKTAATLANMSAQMERLQTPAVTAAIALPKKTKKRGIIQ